MPQLTRLQKLREGREDEQYQPPMPPVEHCSYLIGYLFEAGPTMPGAAGPSSVSNQELRAWQENTGIRLQPWEARTLRRLSQEYIGELHQAEKPDRKAPWQPVDHVPDHAGAAKSARNAIKALLKH